MDVAFLATRDIGLKSSKEAAGFALLASGVSCR
jgi:hypothetical protein